MNFRANQSNRRRWSKAFAAGRKIRVFGIPALKSAKISRDVARWRAFPMRPAWWQGGKKARADKSAGVRMSGILIRCARQHRQRFNSFLAEILHRHFFNDGVNVAQDFSGRASRWLRGVTIDGG